MKLKAFGIMQMSGGVPAVDFSIYPIQGYVHAGSLGGYGAYFVSGTAAQLTALAALANAYAICVVQRDDENTPLDTAITTARRNKINTLLTSKGLPTIPAGTTCRQVIRQVFKRFHDVPGVADWDVDWPLHSIEDTAD